MTQATDTAPQRMEFKTELKQLLDLIIHSLYTKQEIFLRELISNAADAIDKLRFEALKEPTLTAGSDTDWKIRLIADEKAGTLTVSDNGIGMSQEQIVENLGTIAKSGTRAFLDGLRQADAKDRPELIGQFGVGFYASFMVADRVTVLSRPPGENAQGVKWESGGQGDFTLEPFDKPTRGTDVILHLRPDAKDFLQSWRLREAVKTYSDFIEHPIVMAVEREKEGVKTSEDQTFNSRQAIWLRPKSEVTQDEYNGFYKQISHSHDDPLKTVHVAAEGTLEFRALFYIPAHRGFDWMVGPEKKSGLDLYVRRVLIEHECEQLAPSYLRFVKGVVDSADLPLNVSRETLQHNPLLAKISSNVVNRVLKTLEEMKASEYETYVNFYKDFSQYLKEGVGQDWNNRQRLADLLLFESTKTAAGEFTTLEKYLAAMPVSQNEIYYLVGDSREMLANSPYLESFKAAGQEVLLLTEPIDEYLVSSLMTYKEKPLKAADRGEVKADESAATEQKAKSEQLKPALDAVKEKLADEVKDVRLSTRLKESAAILVAEEGELSAHMERLMQRLGRGQDAPPAKRILELNGDHPAVQTLLKIQQHNAADPRIESYAKLFLDQALIAEGSRIKDPAAFARRINDLLASEPASR